MAWFVKNEKDEFYYFSIRMVSKNSSTRQEIFFLLKEKQNSTLQLFFSPTSKKM